MDISEATLDRFASDMEATAANAAELDGKSLVNFLKAQGVAAWAADRLELANALPLPVRTPDEDETGMTLLLDGDTLVHAPIHRIVTDGRGDTVAYTVMEAGSETIVPIYTIR